MRRSPRIVALALSAWSVLATSIVVVAVGQDRAETREAGARRSRPSRGGPGARKGRAPGKGAVDGATTTTAEAAASRGAAAGRAGDGATKGRSRAPGSGEVRVTKTSATGLDPSSASAESDIVREGTNKVKVYRFTGLDVSGRLKTPRLMYFLDRMRTEFDHPELPHRSFEPELLRSGESDSFR